MHRLSGFLVLFSDAIITTKYFNSRFCLFLLFLLLPE